MKRLLALIIIAVTIIPLFAFPISAEEKHEIVLFENGQYKFKLAGYNSDEDTAYLLNLFVSHTNTPYDEKSVSNQDVIYIIAGAWFSDEVKDNFNNKITYSRTNDDNVISIGYDSPENRTALFNKLDEKIRSLPNDRIAIDKSFFTIIENVEENNDNSGFISTIYNNITQGFNSLTQKIDDLNPLSKVFSGAIATVDKATAQTTIRNGGFNYVDEDSPLNNIIATIYKLLYPIGFITMLLCWGFGIAKSTISASLDIKDKSSIIHSVISLILGVAAMSLAPQILTLLTGVSQWLCDSIFEAALIEELFEKIEFEKALSILTIFTGGADQKSLFAIIVLLVVDLIFIINILWIALLQCLSPIFIGLMANQGTRKISFNFIKEYFKAMLVPVVTVIYFFLASTIVQETNIGGMIVALVLAISTLSIAGKKLDKLIN